MALEFGKELTAASTNIPGMLVLDLPAHGDSRDWFKENWQRERMRATGCNGQLGRAVRKLAGGARAPRLRLLRPRYLRPVEPG